MLEKATTAARQTEAVKKQQDVVRSDYKLPTVDAINSQKHGETHKKPTHEQFKHKYSSSQAPLITTNRLASGVAKYLLTGNKTVQLEKPFATNAQTKDTFSQMLYLLQRIPVSVAQASITYKCLVSLQLR